MDEIDRNLRRIRAALERKQSRSSSYDRHSLTQPVASNPREVELIASRSSFEEEKYSFWRHISRLFGRQY
jgi:hypothetical protein